MAIKAREMRAKILPEPWNRPIFSAGGAAERRVLFEYDHLKARLRQIARYDRSVMAAADYDRVIFCICHQFLPLLVAFVPTT
jgi:hypothetical protein